MSDKTNENKKVEKVQENIKEVTDNKSDNANKKMSYKKIKEEEKSFVREVMEWVVCIVVAFTLAVLIKYFLFTPTLVMQESMTPTILNGERVFINRLVRTFDWELKRGDIVTFEAPSEFDLAAGEVKATYREVEGPINSFLYYVLESGKTSYIKRVIGLPGEHVEIRGGKVYIDGTLLEENYLDDSVKTYIPAGGIDDFIVPEGYVFAMGDNRNGSSDCRLFGCVPIEKIEGRVSVRIWPLNKIGKIDK